MYVVKRAARLIETWEYSTVQYQDQICSPKKKFILKNKKKHFPTFF